jgi:hypothetical protein
VCAVGVNREETERYGDFLLALAIAMVVEVAPMGADWKRPGEARRKAGRTESS